MSNQKTNLIAAVKYPTKDGSASAILTASTLFVNNTPTVRQVKPDLWAINFPTNLVGNYKLKNLSYALNGANLKQTEYGVSAWVTIFARTEKQKEYFESVLTKGSRLQTVMARASYTDQYGLKLNVVDGGIGFFNTPKDNEKFSDVEVEQPPFANTEELDEYLRGEGFDVDAMKVDPAALTIHDVRDDEGI